jgi:rod shape-determining protein MreD
VIDAGAATVRGEARAGYGLWSVAALAAVVVLLEVTVMPYLRIADGIPDLVAAMVVSVGVLRGPLVGGVTGFLSGLAVELTAPVGTLGVLALLYLLVGAWCGRYAERPEARTLWVPLGYSVAAAAVVQLGYAGVQLLLGESVSPAQLVAQVLLPTMVLTALLAPPVLLVARRLLGDPRLLEPYRRP